MKIKVGDRDKAIETAKFNLKYGDNYIYVKMSEAFLAECKRADKLVIDCAVLMEALESISNYVGSINQQEIQQSMGSGLGMSAQDICIYRLQERARAVIAQVKGEK